LAAAAYARNLADRELLERFSDRQEEAAFAELVRRHGPMVLGLCRRILQNEHDAEDAFQATFLVLSQKAVSLRPQESLCGWLHSVAYRIAQKVRIDAARRRSHEGRIVARQATDQLAQMTLQEAHEVLHRELARLPGKFRAPLVLCYLEGLTRDEAAHRLGWPVSTLKSRLEQARERLRARLASRGLHLSGVLIAALCYEGTASAAVSLALLDSTVTAATNLAAGGAATAVVSAKVTALTEGVLKAMSVARLKVAAAALLAVSVLGTAAAVIAQHALAQKPADARTEAAPRPAAHAGGRRKPQKRGGCGMPSRATKG
jgi:RNA polymerase sigma factor (sigma-70 family)